MVIGWEALIVLDDIRGLNPQQRTETSVWAAQALIRAALEEHDPTTKNKSIPTPL